MKKVLIFLCAVILCFAFVGCGPQDKTVYAFEQTIKNDDGKFVIKLEKNSFDDADDTAKVSVSFVPAVNYEMTFSYNVPEKEGEVLQCSAVFFDEGNRRHELTTGAKIVSDALMPVKIRKGREIYRIFEFPASYSTLGEDKVVSENGRYVIAFFLIKPGARSEYIFTELFIDVQINAGGTAL